MTTQAAEPGRREALLAAARARRNGVTIYALARKLGRPYRRVFDAVRRYAAQGLLALEPAIRDNRRVVLVRAAGRPAAQVASLPAHLSDAERLALRSLAARVADLDRRVAELRLFGSRARGESRWDSDLDIAVLVRGRRDRALERAIVAAFADVEWSAPLEGALRLSPLVLFGGERHTAVHAAVDREGIALWKAHG
jgi:hypothetical protein